MSFIQTLGINFCHHKSLSCTEDSIVSCLLKSLKFLSSQRKSKYGICKPVNQRIGIPTQVRLSSVDCNRDEYRRTYICLCVTWYSLRYFNQTVYLFPRESRVRGKLADRTPYFPKKAYASCHCLCGVHTLDQCFPWHRFLRTMICNIECVTVRVLDLTLL